MKKMLLFLLTFALLLSQITATCAEEEPEVFTSGDFTYALLEDGSAKILKYPRTNTGSVVIPDALDGHTVTCIGNRAFMDCWNLTDITLPDTVTIIEDKAFSNCINLRSFTLPDSVVSVGINPFSGSIYMEEIIVSQDHPALAVVDGVLFSKEDQRLISCLKALPETEYAVPQGTLAIGDLAFYGCELTNITLPDSVTSIGDGAFYSCKGLTSITFPDSVISIGPNPLRCCDALTTIVVSPDHPALAVIDGVLFSKADQRLVCYPQALTETEYTVPQGITTIGDFAFIMCSSLESVAIPDSVTVIGYNAFCNCSGLTNVTLPDSVTAIGEYAFERCTSLTSIAIPASVTFIGEGALFKCEKLERIIVPRNSYAAQYCQDNDLPFVYSDAQN